jgi:hypothetical protein
MKERQRQRQRQIERKEEVLFRCTDTKHIFGSSLFLFFFIALSLSCGAFCVLRFFHNCFAASCLLFAVCDHITNKKQPTGRGARTPPVQRQKSDKKKRKGLKRNKKEKIARDE